jgi:adenylylsulfate kinase-like enzyme
MIKVVVVSGTLGAGKTKLASNIRDLLTQRKMRCAFVDLDALCDMDPAPVEDRYNQRLMFANLAAIWPNYEAIGVEYLVLARVVEDISDRLHYVKSLNGADVKIVRVEASSTTRRARLTEREPEGFWREGHLRRTDDLAKTLQDLDLDDFVVQNDGRSIVDVAAEVVGFLKW